MKPKSRRKVAGAGRHEGKHAKFKLPPMWPHVVASEFLKDDASRARLFEWVGVLDQWRVLEDVRAYIRVEKGALVRMRRVLPASVKKAAAFGLRVFHFFEHLVAEVGTLNFMRAERAADSASWEQVVLRHLQQALDLVHESQTVFDSRARESLAGLGGCDVQALRRFWASSGIEAGVHVADQLRPAVRGEGGNPFARWVPLAKEQKKEKQRLGKQTGRPCPETPLDTNPYDRAVLWAVQAGARSAKKVVSMTEQFGCSCSLSHVRKRKGDLTAWGLLREVRDFELTDDGRVWVSKMPRPPRRRRST